MGKLKVVLVGCGFMGKMHANVYQLLEDAEVVAWVDQYLDKAEGYATEFGGRAYRTLAEALAENELDVVDVCVPTDKHKQFVLEAAAARKHVLCEKPMALNVTDAKAMIQACEEAGVRLMIGHCIRFWPEYAFLKKLKDEGSLGKLLSINLTRYGEFPSWTTDDWSSSEARCGGGALDMHIHDTDFALYLLGEPKDIRSAGIEDSRGVSHIFTTFTYADGAVAQLEGGWNLPEKTPFWMTFRAVFENGAAIMEGGPLTVYQNGKEPTVPEFTTMKAAGGGNISNLGGYYYEIAEFVNCVKNDKPFTISTPATSFASLETCLTEIAQVKAARF